MNDAVFSQLDFGPLKEFLETDDITDISYSNGGQVWLKSLTKGIYQVDRPEINNAMMEKLAFQCSNVMGKTFNMASPFLDAESAELRMNFIHESISTNGIACVIRKTPAKIRLNKDKLINERYTTVEIHDFLIKCVEGHCNIMVAGETGSGKTEFVKYLASHTKTNEKIITIEDTLELHLDKIFPQRDIVAMKTNNVASYSDVLVTCMRQNPKWILLSEVRSAEAVSAVRNSISSGHNILSTIHADKASAIPYRLYSLMETDLDVNQFLTTIYRYIQIGVHIKAFYSKEYGNFHREMDEVTEFYVDENNVPQSRIIYQKVMGKPMMCKPSDHLIEYLENQNVDVHDIIKDLPKEMPIVEYEDVNDTEDKLTDDNTEVDSVSPSSETTTEVSNVASTNSNVVNSIVNSSNNVNPNVINQNPSVTAGTGVPIANGEVTKTPIINGQAPSIPVVNNGDVLMSNTPVVNSNQVVQSVPVVNNASVVPNVTNQVVQPQVSVVGMQNATSTPVVPIVNTQMPVIDKLGE